MILRSLTTERLYSLGDFRNIKFSDEIRDIPEEVALNKDAMALLHYVQLLDTEYAYNRYLELAKANNTIKQEEILTFLESERTRTFEDLLKTLKH